MKEMTERFARICSQWHQLHQEVVAERDAARAEIRKLRAELAAARVHQ